MVSLVACVGGETDNLANSDEALSRGAGTTQWWETQRAERQAELDAFIAANREDFDWFKDAPLGNSGIPMVMFRVLPELFPEIWGAPGTNFTAVGLDADPYEPGRVLPLGLGYSGAPAIPTPVGPVKVQVVTLTCMGCHGGRVQGADGDVHTVVGAPNTQFSGFRNAVIRTVMHPGYTAARFRAAVVAKPVIDWASFVLTSDEYPYFVKYWFPGMPWEIPEQYWERSPLSLVGNVTTPTMVLTGESDWRTPISESEQYYQALKLRDVDTALVRIPEASHSMTDRPSRLAAKVATILEWFARHAD